MKSLFCVAGILMLAQPAFAQTVLESDFTISVPNGSGTPVVESSTMVPLLEGTCYDWHLRLAKVKGEVAVTEVYSLPEAPETWGLGENASITVSDDQKTATSLLLLTPEDGWINSGWCVSVGDPAGTYTIKVMVGERILHFFEFELQEM